MLLVRLVVEVGRPLLLGVRCCEGEVEVLRLGVVVVEVLDDRVEVEVGRCGVVVVVFVAVLLSLMVRCGVDVVRLGAVVRLGVVVRLGIVVEVGVVAGVVVALLVGRPVEVEGVRPVEVLVVGLVGVVDVVRIVVPLVRVSLVPWLDEG